MFTIKELENLLPPFITQVSENYFIVDAGGCDKNGRRFVIGTNRIGVNEIYKLLDEAIKNYKIK
jgi:hypothetical protein